MYLFERICGIGSYLLLLIVFYVKIRNSEPKNRSKILTVYAVLLSALAFFYVPNYEADLTRWWIIVDGWKSKSFEEMFDFAFSNSSTPVAYLYMYTLGKYVSNGMIPAASSLIYYLCVFHIVSDYSKRNNISSESTALSLFFCMSSGLYLEVISGVRCMMALSVVSLGIYRYYFEKRKINFLNMLLYIFAALVHNAAIALILLHFAILIIASEKKLVYKIGLIFILGTSLILFREKVLPYIFDTIDHFSNFTSSKHYSYIWEYIINAISLFTIILVMRERIFIQKNQVDKEISLKIDRGYLFLLYCLALIEILFCFEYSTFHRFISIQMVLSIPLFMSTLNGKENKVIKSNIMLLSELALMLASVRGNLCGLKFFIL